MAQVAVQGLRTVLGVVASPFVRFGTAYAAAAERRPFVVGVLTTGFKTSAADLFAQMVMEKKQWHEIDSKRHFTFCLFGFTYLGAFQYFFYTKVLVWATNPITRTMGHIASAPAKTFVDQAFHHPFMYFPTFYLMKYSLVGGESVDVALTRYSDELWPNCNALWKLWVPCQLLNFSMVPIHLQVPYVAAVSFVWTIILSMMRGSDTSKVEDKQAVEAAVEHPSATAVGDGTLPQGASGEKESEVGRAPLANTGASTPEATGAVKASEGAVATGTGVPVGGILAVASQSTEQEHASETPSSAPDGAVAPEVSSDDMHRQPQRAHTIEGLAAAATVPDIGFGAHMHAHASVAATPQLDHQSPAIAAAASMSEHAHARGGPAGPSAAASIAEPLVLCPHAVAHVSGTDGHACSAAGDDAGVIGFAFKSMDRRVCSAVAKDVLELWSGAAGLLHLQHPLKVSS